MEVLDKERVNELDDVLFLFFLEVGVIYREWLSFSVLVIDDVGNVYVIIFMNRVYLFLV